MSFNEFQAAQHAKRMRKARNGAILCLVSMLIFFITITYYVVTVETSLPGCAP